MSVAATAVRPIRVLLVDDTDDVRLLLRLALDKAGGFEVVAEAGDGEAAIRAAAEQQPDLVLLDLAMPVMDGLQALPFIRSCAPDSRVVVLSGFDAEAMAGEAIDAGATTYVYKGTPILELASKLRAVVGVQEPLGRDEPATGPDFLAMVAHELKSPISTVAGLAELLEEGWDAFDEVRRREMARAIGRQARPLVRLVNDLLLAARLEGGQLSVSSQPVALDAVVQGAIAVAATSTDDVMVTGDTGVVVTADAERVQQILVNLLANAQRHGRPPIHLTVTDGPAVTVAVRDHGPGVAAADEPLLFARFSQLARGKVGSHGLGLHLSRNLARAMGGDLTHAAVEPGAEFIVVLPR